MSAEAEEPQLEVAVPVATLWTSPDAPRDIDACAVADSPDMAAWTRSMDREARAGLHGRTLTQALLGEPVRVLEERGRWLRVVCPDQPSSGDPAGYPGWVPRAHVAHRAAPTDGPVVSVTALSTRCFLDSGEVLELSFATRIRAETLGRDAVVVLLPGGRRGDVARSDVRLLTGEEPGDAEGKELLATAARFLGLRYLWGGSSAWGLDCSGLVHLVLRGHDVTVPRDAFDQAEGRHLQPVPLDAVRPGDLYFFARPGERVYHVGFASRPVGEDGTRWMLHAPEGGELIEDAPLAPHRRATLIRAGRVSCR